MDSRLDGRVVVGARLSAASEHARFDRCENVDFESFENTESAG